MEHGEVKGRKAVEDQENGQVSSLIGNAATEAKLPANGGQVDSSVTSVEGVSTSLQAESSSSVIMEKKG